MGAQLMGYVVGSLAPIDAVSPQAPEDPPGDTTGARWGSIILLVLSAAVQLGTGIAALAGNSSFENNVRTIEANPNFGNLYLSLGEWGAVALIVGLMEIAAAAALIRRTQNARIYGLGASLCGLVIAFFTLAIFHLINLAPLALLFSALYVLSYRVD